MNKAVRLLHVTDSHVLLEGGDNQPHDVKTNIRSGEQSRADAFELLFKRISEELSTRGERLEGVIFSGDALAKGKAGGNQVLLDLFKKHFGVTPERIVAVPGNHDVPKGTEPSSAERYKDFVAVWRGTKCITPWLDGIDAATGTTDWKQHVLLAGDNSWAVMAVNSCNWSHTNAEVPDGLQSVWGQLAAGVSGSDDKKKEVVEKELQSLIQHDAAHISRAQFERIKEMFERLPQPKAGRQLRMVVLHHHLRNPNLRLEFKTMPDLIPLEQFRDLLREQDVKVVFHGHKHVWRQHLDYIEPRHEVGGSPHKVLVLAGGTFSDQNGLHAAGSVHIDGLPWTPTLRVDTHEVPAAGLKLQSHLGKDIRLWDCAEGGPYPPLTVIQGSNLDEVYAKVRAFASSDSRDAPMVVQLDLRPEEPLWLLPHGYPTPVAEQRRPGWLEGLVHWWQQRDSRLEGRVPYIHGTRLLRYGNNIDQIQRVIELLQVGNTSRALAVLVDPRLDFHDNPKKAEFASFCMVQFIKRKTGEGEFVDVIGYYRAQEMLQWWPINVAELRYLQRKVIEGGVRAAPGRITTIAASARVDNAPSPTHVAMPLIDRWLDQSPEKFFKLAMFMLSGRANPHDEAVVQEWLDELEALQESARRPARDGGPVVAIDGPDRLAAYLLAGTGPNQQDCKELAKVLNEIARQAETRPQKLEGMAGWQGIMQDRLMTAIALSRKTLGLPPAATRQSSS